MARRKPRWGRPGFDKRAEFFVQHDKAIQNVPERRLDYGRPSERMTAEVWDLLEPFMSAQLAVENWVVTKVR